MQTKFIKTEDYLLLVGENKFMKKGDKFLFTFITNEICTFKSETLADFLTTENDSRNNRSCHKILAHLPLNNAPILEGVDLLPELDNGLDKLSKDLFSTPLKIKKRGVKNNFLNPLKGFKKWDIAFKAGYKAAQARQFTLEDLEKAIELAREMDYSNYEYYGSCEKTYSKEEIIQQIQQSKLPVDFVCQFDTIISKHIPYPKELEVVGQGYELGYPVTEKVLKTIPNPQGQKVVQGEYKFE